MKTADKVATIVLRVIAGIFGLAVLYVAVKSRLYAQGWHAFLTFGSFCGLLLGYAFGGDKWGARLFRFFTGHHVPVKKEDTQGQKRPGTNDITRPPPGD
jgi:hypothetical protein